MSSIFINRMLNMADTTDHIILGVQGDQGAPGGVLLLCSEVEISTVHHDAALG